MYLRRVLKYPKENNYLCKTYQRYGNNHCTAHRISEQDLHAVILQKLREVTAYVRENPEEFYEIASRNARAEAEREMKTYLREKEAAEQRIAELESIIRCCTKTECSDEFLLNATNHCHQDMKPSSQN